MRKCGLAVDHQSFSITFPQISTASEWFDQRSSKSLFLSVSTASCGLIHRMANIVLATIESELTLLFSAVQFSVRFLAQSCTNLQIDLLNDVALISST